MKRLPAAVTACAVMLAVLGPSACVRDPETRKRQFFERGEAAFKAGDYREAALAYQNAIKIDGRFGRAFFRLGEAQDRLENGEAAMRAYVRAADLMPEHTDAQLRAANYLMLARRYQEARTRALSVVAREPTNVEALILVGNASAGLNDLDGAVKQLQEALRLDPGEQRAYNNLGWFQALRSNQAEAERVFRNAVALGPRSSDAHLALANFLLAVGRRDEAEQALRTAVSLAPRQVAANRALGWMLAVTNRMAEAEPYFVAVAASDPEPAGKLQLADFYAWSGRGTEAVNVLEDVRKDRRALVDADTRLASALYAAGDKTRARDVLKEALAASPGSAEARLLSADFALRDGRPRDAMAVVERILADDARYAPAQFTRGQALIALGRPSEAKQAFGEVIRLNPRATTARLYLARLELDAGDPTTARQLADEVLRLVPGNAGAQLIVAQTMLAKGELDGAARMLEGLAAAFPDWVSPRIERSKLAVAQGSWERARQEVDRVEALSPGSPAAFEGRLAIAVGTRAADAARREIETRLAAHPQDTRALLVSAQAYTALAEHARAEEVLTRLLSLDAANQDAYDLLGRVYYVTGRVAQAEAQFAAMAAHDPKAVYPLVLAGVLAHAQGKLDVARQRYEQVLGIDSNVAVAANNLAWLYVEQGGNLDVALQLAQSAKAAAPTNGEFGDTLGAVLMKKGLWSSAVRELREAAALAPKNATIRFHLAQALLGAGEKVQARSVAEEALRLDPDFPEAGMARSMLAGRAGS